MRRTPTTSSSDCVHAVRGLWFCRVVHRAGPVHRCTEVPIAGRCYDNPRVLRAVLRTSRSLWASQPLIAVAHARTYVRTGRIVYAGVHGRSLFEAEALRCPVDTGVIGDCLGELHGVGVDPSHLAVLPRRPLTFESTATWYRENAGRDSAFATLRTAPYLVGLFESVLNGDWRSAEVVLHGRWSSGAIHLCSAGTLRVLTGPDVWVGPAEFDLAFLIGEWLEAAADALAGGGRPGGPVRFFESRIGPFLCAYTRHRTISMGLLQRFVVYRVLAHLCWNHKWRLLEGLAPLRSLEVEAAVEGLGLLLPAIQGSCDDRAHRH